LAFFAFAIIFTLFIYADAAIISLPPLPIFILHLLTLPFSLDFRCQPRHSPMLSH
jgi:hypothetical protein